MNMRVFKRKSTPIKFRQNNNSVEFSERYRKPSNQKNKNIHSMRLYRSIKCEQVLDNIACLIHSTNLYSFGQILNSFKIKAHEGDPEKVIRGYTERLNKGAFFQVLFKCNSGAPIIQTSICKIEIVLVFSKLLLQRDDYHINNNWFGGIKVKPLVPNKRMDIPFESYGNIIDYINSNLNCSKNDRNVNISKNECVFQNDVSLSYLREIWICNNHPRTIMQSVKMDDVFERYEDQAPYPPEDLYKEVYNRLVERDLHRMIKIKIINEVPETEKDECHEYR
jgi:hypothetical protein